MIASPVRYSVFCALVLGGLACLVGQGTRIGLLPALLLLPLVAWPAWIALAYAAAVHRAQVRSVLRDGAAPWWAWALGGALWRQTLAVPVALMAAGSVGWWLLAEGWAGLGWVAASAGALYPVAALMSRQTAALKPYARLRPVLLLAPPVAAGALTLAWGLAAGMDTLDQGTLAERVAAGPRYEGPSALLGWSVDGMAVLSGVRAWGLDWTEERVGLASAVWRAGATFATFWLMTCVFTGLLLPRGEARRILRPCDADLPLPAGAGRLAWAAALLAILSGVLASALAEAEAWAASWQRPVAQADMPGLEAPMSADPQPLLAGRSDAPLAVEPPQRLTPGALRRIVEAEQIGRLACTPGTLAGLEAFDRDIAHLRAERRAKVEQAARAGFDRIRAQVPAFLDGYYSLTAEYLRTFHLVAGDAEAVLAQEMAAAFRVDQAFAGFEAATLALGAPLPAGMQDARERLLADCGFLPEDGDALRIVATAPAELLETVPDAATVVLGARLAASGAGMAAGGVAGVMAGKLVAKLLAKEAVGLAAEAMAKLALGKAAGGLGGAVTGAGAGALAGSVVPGIGTTIGAVLGGVLGGLTIGAATDYALIELEEAVSRDDFERQIHTAIDEAEAELLAALDGPN